IGFIDNSALGFRLLPIVPRVVIAKQRNHPTKMVGADIQPARGGINTRTRPFRAAIHSPVKIRTAEARGPKETRSDTLEAARREFRNLGITVGEIRRGEFHFGETLRQLRVRLVRRGNLPGQIAGWGAAHSKWEYGFATHAIEQQRIAV